MRPRPDRVRLVTGVPIGAIIVASERLRRNMSSVTGGGGGGVKYGP